jgi:hypothetical protein
VNWLWGLVPARLDLPCGKDRANEQQGDIGKRKHQREGAEVRREELEHSEELTVMR